MAFVYDAKHASVYDEDSDSYIAESPSKSAEAEDQVTFMLKQGEMRCFFDLVSIDTYVADYKPPKPKKFMAWGRGKAEPGGLFTFVLEDSLRKGLADALHQMGNMSLSEVKYSEVKALLADGLYVLMTEGGENVKKFPAKKFEVRFESNLAAVATQHPGKLLKYEQWLKAVGDDGKPKPD